MRQLAATGWMHNRARLITACFLIKDLHIDWRRGEQHFMRLLLDGDEANNNGNWQWIASVGVDPAPVYRRLYNPMLQQRRHDPDGAYVRRWSPSSRTFPTSCWRRRGRPGTPRRSSTTPSSAGARWRPTAPRARRVCAITELYVQRDQPHGVEPLHLTGERTLPDVPEENYWYRRHLVVYEWIAQRVHGRRVVDLASGEGYGAAVLARTASSVVGVEANLEAFEHARAKYARRRLRAHVVELWQGDVDGVVFLQTIEHIQDPDAMLEHIRTLIEPGGVAYVSTPNVLTLAPKGAERSGNPWHVREYRPDEYRALCERHFARVDLLGLFHARKLRAHELALRLGLGPRPPDAAPHAAVLRPLHAGDLGARLRAAAARSRPQPRPAGGAAAVR